MRRVYRERTRSVEASNNAQLHQSRTCVDLVFDSANNKRE
jgi:hypothetical protein